MMNHSLQSASNSHISYAALAEAYDAGRPRYPDEIISFVVDRAKSTKYGTFFALDVRAGIFSKQLARRLPHNASIIAIEPNDDVRRKAVSESADNPNMRYMPGSAERLPIGDGTISLVTAATAVTRFDRPKFYGEAHRVLTRSGLLAVLMIRRDLDRSAMHRECELYHEKYIAGFKAGCFENYKGHYESAHIVSELKASPLFRSVRHLELYWADSLTWDKFKAVSLSRSDTKKLIKRSGMKAAMRWHYSLFERYAATNGTIEFPWLAEVTIAQTATAT
ncbi:MULTISPECIES: class I SAM-dependent methyltransferase [unclassified Bradyrhizobium]|uniref:class I SAM-dependent methyltransferase n=1 Tax=unclassified Bradyrhizobium TaxID=2631580 RepID=UPI003394B0EF